MKCAVSLHRLPQTAYLIGICTSMTKSKISSVQPILPLQKEDKLHSYGNMEEMTLFDTIDTQDVDEQNEIPPFEYKTEEDKYIDLVEEKDITISPDDLTVIRLLIEKESYRYENDLQYTVEQFIDKQMEGKFDIFDDNINDIDKLRQWAIDKAYPRFHEVQQVLLDVLYICADEMQSISLNPNKDNADYIAYLYNINAPFHQKAPLPYKDLINVLRACE